MAITEFTDGVEIDGSQDISQLRVQGHTTQTEALQTWEDSDAVELAQISGDGRLLVGDDLGMATPDALIEAHRDSTSSRPNRAFHALGRVAGTLSDAVQWIVHELEILGSGAVNGLHSTLRVRLRQASTGDASEAELRAADIEAVNETGTAETRTGQITGLRAAVSNSSEGYVDQAVGLDVVVNNSNPDAEDDPINTAYGIRVGDVDQAGANYALHTGAGTVHLGDVLEVPVRSDAPPGDPPADHYKVYFKEEEGDPRLYVKDETGAEKQVAGAGQAASFQYDMDQGVSSQTIEAGKAQLFGDEVEGSGDIVVSGMLQVGRVKLRPEYLELPILEGHPSPPASGQSAIYRLKEGIYKMNSAGHRRLLTGDFPDGYSCFPHQAKATANAGNWNNNYHLTGFAFFVAGYFSPATAGDKVEWKRILKPGVWRIGMLGHKDTTNRGAWDLHVNGPGAFSETLSGTQVGAAGIFNFDVGTISVSTLGLYTFELETKAGTGNPNVFVSRLLLRLER